MSRRGSGNKFRLPSRLRETTVCCVVFFVSPGVFVSVAGERPAAGAAAKSQATGNAAGDHSGQELFVGKVVLLREALARRKIPARDEFDKQVVLETRDGELIPLVPDWRGRAFFQDERLRNRDVELVGKRQKGVPYLQVLIVYTFDRQGNRQYTDYYCDTCAFPMYEIKPCECCQGPVRLRYQRRDLPDFIKARIPQASRPAKTKTPSIKSGS